jgi:hypothetical protein
MSPPAWPPPFALAWASEFSVTGLAPYGFGAPTLALGPLDPDLRGLQLVSWWQRLDCCHRPLMPFASRSEFVPNFPAQLSCTANGATLLWLILPWGLSALRRLQRVAATHTRVASPGCAAPSGFLNLLTLCSAAHLPALFRAGSALGLLVFRGVPSPVAGASLNATFPPCCLPRARSVEPKSVVVSPASQLRGFAQPESPCHQTDVTR